MMPVFPSKTTQTTSFMSFCLLIMLSVAIGCQQDKKSAAAPEAPAQTTTPATREEAMAPSEDYSSFIMEVAKKEYEPLGRKIVANREQLRALKAASEASSEVRDAGKTKDHEKRQSQTEADFVESMKILDYLVEKQNSGEMTKEALATEKKQIQKKIQEVEMVTTDLEKALKSDKN